MASDPYGRDGYDDRADDPRPRSRPLDQAGEQRGQEQHPFGNVNYPGHDYWATTGRPDAPGEPRAYDGGWTRRDAPTGREAVPGRDVAPGREIPPGREVPPRREIPPGREMPPGREVPLGRDAAPGREAPPWREVPPGRDAAPGREAPPRREVPPGRDAVPGRGAPPGRGGYQRDDYDRDRPARAWDDPYGSRRGRWDRDEPPMVRDRAFEPAGYEEPGYAERRDRGERYERSFDRGERSTGSGSRSRARGGYDDESASSSPSSWRSKVRRKRKNMPLWQELPLLLIVAFCLAVLIRTFLVQAFFIPSGSMEETLLVGDRVLVNKVLYDVREPERGEVVVFTGPDTWAPENQINRNGGFFAELGRTVGDLVGFSQPGEKDFIKRVIGLPGDTVECCDANGRVMVNGSPLDESSYLYEDSPLDAAPNPRQCTARRFGPVKVQAGQMFVMGDHRGVSQDSRCQGPVPIDNVIGRAFVILWPSDRWGWLSVPATFKDVRKPAALGPPVTQTPLAPLVPDVVVAPIAASLALSTRSARQARLRRRRW